MVSKITIVIVNWNGGKFLYRLFRSLESAVQNSIIVIDNASSDSSMEILARYPNVQTIRNNQNVGFGAAANQGIALSKTPFVLLLNVDTELLPGAIETLAEFLIENPKAAVVAPQLVFPGGKFQPSVRSFPTISGLFLYLSYLDRVIPSSYRLGSELHHITREVDQPMGAALMMRRDALNEVGGFDQRFFLYMEDVDLCERIKKKGWKIFYLPTAKMIHFAGGSSEQNWEKSQFYFIQSLIRYFQKRPGSSMMIVKFSLCIAFLIRALVSVFSGEAERSLFYLKMSLKLWSMN
jgi:GT2 family glycosyltransferase